jgi:hypothetical protein
MTEQLQKTTEEEISKLPKELQQAIAFCDWLDISKKTGEKYSLLEEEIDDLQVEILLVLVNAEFLENLSLNIEDRIQIKKETSDKIVEDLTLNIFVPIQNKLNEILKNIYKGKTMTWKQKINFVVSGGDYTVFLK